MQIGGNMNYGKTTSIRLPAELSEQLEQASQTLHRGKNWIIKEAVQEYLIKHGHAVLAEEARRQSILASQSDNEKPWEDTDTSGWS